MSYRDTLCNKCLGCNKLELPSFQGVYSCKYAVIVKNEHKQTIPMKTKVVHESINKIHKILGASPSNITEGEQIKL